MGNHDEFDLDVRLISDRRMQASQPDVAATLPHTKCNGDTCTPDCNTKLCTRLADCGGRTADCAATDAGCGPTGPNCETAATCQTFCGVTCAGCTQAPNC